MKNIKCLSGVAVSALLLPATSYAQIEEVIVTAQKREQSVLDVPVTMDVVSGKFLEQSSISELDDLSRFLPNVVIQEQAVSLPSFNIRGITDDTAAITSTPRISVYQDGFDISKKTLASAALFDVERIEVLKGPQPTLFGMAAANGAVSILSKRPSSEFELETKLAFYNDSGTDFKGMVNVPITDSLNFRLATLYRQQDGTVKNRACAPGSYNTSGQIENVYGVSPQLVFSLNDNIESFVGASYNRDKSELPYSILIDPYVRGAGRTAGIRFNARY